MAGLPERPPTELAGVRLLARVRPHVVAQPRPPAEGLVADFAGEGLLSRVHPHVDVHGAPPDKALPAHPAGVRLLARVGSDVTGQGVALAEALVADVAGEGLLARVPPQVTQQVAVEAELLPADLAGERLLARVGDHVAEGAVPPGEPPRTQLAGVRLLLLVGVPVVVEQQHVGEPFAAGSAEERFGFVGVLGLLGAARFRLAMLALVIVNRHHEDVGLLSLSSLTAAALVLLLFDLRMLWYLQVQDKVLFLLSQNSLPIDTVLLDFWKKNTKQKVIPLLSRRLLQTLLQRMDAIEINFHHLKVNVEVKTRHGNKTTLPMIANSEQQPGSTASIDHWSTV